jgi:hypothetical protein
LYYPPHQVRSYPFGRGATDYHSHAGRGLPRWMTSWMDSFST